MSSIFWTPTQSVAFVYFSSYFSNVCQFHGHLVLIDSTMESRK